MISDCAKIGRVDLVCGDINMARWPKDEPHSHAHCPLTPHSTPLLTQPHFSLNPTSSIQCPLTPQANPPHGRFCGCPQDGWHTEVWRANVVDAFKSNNVAPVSDTNSDCCFIAAHDELAESHHVRGSSWANVIGDSKEKWLEFSKKVQCKATSHDVH